MMMLLALPMLAALAAAPRAQERFLETEVIDAQRVAGALSADAPAASWAKLPATHVLLAPQRTVRFNDRDANEALDVLGAPRVLDVRAAYNERDLALVLEWRDDSADRAPATETDRFGDAVAVEVPLAFGPGQRLPYVGMGDERAPVMLYLQRAIEHGSLGRELVAAGFGSSTRSSLGGARMAMRYDAASRTWRAVLVRPLVTMGHDLRPGLVPVAFALWDGAHHERGGNKALSSWKAIRLGGTPLNPAFLDELSWGYDAPGDVVRGKLLVETICASCHRTGTRDSAAPGAAPPLDQMGLLATPSYLRESIVSPDEVIVPGKGWSRRGDDGQHRSLMPSMGGLPPADIVSIVTYLRTLGVPAGAASAKRSAP